MMQFDFQTLLRRIQSIENAQLLSQIQAHLNDLTKPPGSLGRLEEIALQYCLCRGSAEARINRMEICTFAGDHGITAQDITPYPAEVTPQMVRNMVNGGAAISVMCRRASIASRVVDVGVNADFGNLGGLVQRKVRRGTRDFSIEPAMSPQECVQAMGVGAEMAHESHADLLGIGEMGIGNSASASAIFSLILGVDASQTIGPGTGASGDLLARKLRVVDAGVALHRASWDGTSFDALCRVGGLEIAAMTGMILSAAARRIPVVVDGFIASAAALAALRMQPIVGEYLFWSHTSAEGFHAEFLRREHFRPILNLGMRLGEGTGAALAMQIIAQAMACYNEMATFSSGKVAGSKYD